MSDSKVEANATASGGAAPAEVAAQPMDGWVLSTLPRAMAFARGLVGDVDVAEDIVHDCYCRLLGRSEAYDLKRDGAKLLFRSITNACIDRSRKRKAVSLFESDDEGGAGRLRELTDTRSPEPWQEATHHELQAAVAAGLDKLPVVQRAALELKSLGQSLQEIAEALGVTPTNAGVLIHRGRQALHRHIAAAIDG